MLFLTLKICVSHLNKCVTSHDKTNYIERECRYVKLMLIRDYYSNREPYNLHKLIKRQLLNQIKIQHVNIYINGVNKETLFTIMQHIN